MPGRRGRLVVQETWGLEPRAVRAVGILGLLLAELVVGYLLTRAAVATVQGIANLAQLAAAAILLSAFVIGFFFLLVTVRMGPNTVYEDGLDLRDRGAVLGRTFHPWEDFTQARIEVLGQASHSVRRILLDRPGKARPIVLTTAYGETEFVETFERFLEASGVLRVSRE